MTVCIIQYHSELHCSSVSDIAANCITAANASDCCVHSRKCRATISPWQNMTSFNTVQHSSHSFTQAVHSSNKQDYFALQPVIQQASNFSYKLESTLQFTKQWAGGFNVSRFLNLALINIIFKFWRLKIIEVWLQCPVFTVTKRILSESFGMAYIHNTGVLHHVQNYLFKSVQKHFVKQF